jgi:hypothetical protein
MFGWTMLPALASRRPPPEPSLLLVHRPAEAAVRPAWCYSTPGRARLLHAAQPGSERTPDRRHLAERRAGSKLTRNQRKRAESCTSSGPSLSAPSSG